jgi:hypothetical protein
MANGDIELLLLKENKNESSLLRAGGVNTD